MSVTPFVGVWIETYRGDITARELRVTPFVGVWIETSLLACFSQALRSHTLRGCVD